MPTNNPIRRFLLLKTDFKISQNATVYLEINTKRFMVYLQTVWFKKLEFESVAEEMI